MYIVPPCYDYVLNCHLAYLAIPGTLQLCMKSNICLFYLYSTSKIEIQICSNKHETGLVHHWRNFNQKLCSCNEITNEWMNKQSNIHTNEIYIPLSINAGGIITPTLPMIGDNSRYQLELIPQIYNLCIKDNFYCVFQLMLTIIKSCWEVSWDETVLSKGKSF